MPRFEEYLDIRAPIAAVFDAVTDPKRGMEWNPNIIDVSAISVYPVREGSTWLQTVSVQGRPVEMQCRIETFHPPYEGTLQVTGAHQATIWTRCEPQGAMVRVTQTMEFVMPGGKLGAFASGLVKNALKREVARALQRQHDALEKEYGTGDEPGTP
ncbi:MAG: hypothetical protein NVS2B16_27670 [Chloroflexota bacterium]